jgi:hypothetical protein
MKGKLIKQGNEYFLRSLIKDIPSSINVYHKISETEGEFGFGKHSGKLSIQNCDEIFGVVDVEKLVEDSYIKHYKKNNLSLDELIQRSCGFIVGFKNGFNKAMELNKDKVFTIEDMIKAIDFDSFENEHEGKFYESKEKFIQSLQQPTEIEVEIIMDKIPADLAPGGWDVFPKLDESGCLILKKIL